MSVAVAAKTAPWPRPVADEARALFLRGLRRPSTLAVGSAVFDALQDAGPEGAALNVSELARQTGYSRRTVQIAISVLVRWGRILPGPADRGHPGRPRAYTLHPCYRKAVQVFISEKRATSSFTISNTPTTENALRSTPPGGPATANPSSYDQKRTSTPLPNSNGDPHELLDPLRARRRVLGRLRDHLRGYPGLSPLSVDRLLNGVGAALGRRWPTTGPGIPRWETDLVFVTIRRYVDEDEGFSLSERKSYACGALGVAAALEALESARRVRAWVRARSSPPAPTADGPTPSPATPPTAATPANGVPKPSLGGETLAKRVQTGVSAGPRRVNPVAKAIPTDDDSLPVDPKARLEVMAAVRREWADPSAVAAAEEALRRVFPGFGKRKTQIPT